MALKLLGAIDAKLTAVLQSDRVRELLHDNQLDVYELEGTIGKLKAMILLNANIYHNDATSLSPYLIARLKSVVSEADALLDEVKINSKGRRPSSNSITQQFDNIKSILNDLFIQCSPDPHHPLVDRTPTPVVVRYETYSDVDEKDIIGRDADKIAVLDRVFSWYDQLNSNLCFITILGTGGVGKTALAQLVFNDEMVKKIFSLRIWVCISENLSLKSVIHKICLQCSIDVGNEKEITLEKLVQRLRDTLVGENLLVVLDDVWSNAKILWEDLGDIIFDNYPGCTTVLVTTRSVTVAKIISNNFIHELNSLSDEDSFKLFKRLAFRPNQEPDVELVHIAKELTKKCDNVPHIIKVIASMVYGQEKTKWDSLMGLYIRQLPQVKEKLENLRHIDGFDDKHGSIQIMEETCSHVKKERIIGRGRDKVAVMDMLFSYDATEDDVSYLSIVGMAGMGKTALAQLVFNDDRIKCKFELRFWVCVADHSQDFVKSFFHKILEKSVDESCFTTEQLMKKVGEKIRRKRYFLVLDDVWCEDHRLWLELRNLLRHGDKGSIVLITSRSKIVATVSASSYTYELKGLSEEHSWKLFKKSAFQPGELYLQESDDKLLHIRREITQLCSGVPLIIRVLGSVLFSEDKTEWLKLKANDLVELSQVKEHIMPTLRLSYDQLDYDLKKCFRFCAIFPINYVIQKQVLISLWLAQDCLVPTHEAQSMEEIGEDYCLKLLSRCFFKNIQQDEYGEVMSFEMHHLIHELAQEVAGLTFLMLPVADSNIFRRMNICHLSVSEYGCSSVDLFNPNVLNVFKTLETIFNLRGYALCSPQDVAATISVTKHLRVLDLQNLALRKLPDTFDNVPHLRYLDLSDNEVKMLPASIARLHNLCVLRLCGCTNLKELPDDLSNLIKLRHLDVVGCNRLSCMPVGLDRLTCLERLTMFVVGGGDSNQVNRGRVINLEANRLVKLRGELLIKVVQFSPSNMQNVIERACIVKDAKQLRTLEIMYADASSEAGEVHEGLLARFHPNQFLRRIVIQGFQGTLLPSWALAMATIVPNLVSIKLSHFRGLQHLTTLSQLHHLKYLHLRKMWNVESIEKDAPFALLSTSTEPIEFFPALEKLVLDWMPNLKRWWRGLDWKMKEAGSGCLVDGNGVHMEQLIRPFSRLRDLSIYHCSSLTYFPPCPHVKSLDLRGINEEMTFCAKGGDPTLCLEKLSLYYNARVLESIVGEFVAPGTFEINLKYFHKEKNLSKAREAFQRCASSLRNLSIDGFYKLESLTGGGIEHLTNLQSLSIMDCFELDFVEVELEQEGMPWKSLQSLSSLTFDRIPKMVNLPKGLQYLTSLQSLHIKRCNNLKAFGECLRDLTSLQAFHIEDCKNLKTIPQYLKLPTSKLELHIKNCPELESA